MPSYAILGATGSTGSAVLKQLSATADAHLNVYVRSKTKLLQSFPNLASNPRVQIFAGSLGDTALMASCLEGVDAVFATVATNDSIPGCRVAQDAAQSIVAALCEIQNKSLGVGVSEAKAKGTPKTPKILFLSSASLSPHLMKTTPGFAKWLLHTALFNVYSDLAHAEEYLRLHSSWLDVVFIYPPGLSNDKRRGYALSLEHVEGFLSYPDLAAGMIEVAGSDDSFSWKGVGITPTSRDVKFEWMAPVNVAKGLLWHVAPQLYWLGKRVGLV